MIPPRISAQPNTKAIDPMHVQGAGVISMRSSLGWGSRQTHPSSEDQQRLLPRREIAKGLAAARPGGDRYLMGVSVRLCRAEQFALGRHGRRELFAVRA
jgi:hypothetical protein